MGQSRASPSGSPAFPDPARPRSPTCWSGSCSAGAQAGGARRRRGAREPVQGTRLLEGGPRHEHPQDRLRREPALAQRGGSARRCFAAGSSESATAELIDLFADRLAVAVPGPVGPTANFLESCADVPPSNAPRQSAWWRAAVQHQASAPDHPAARRTSIFAFVADQLPRSAQGLAPEPVARSPCGRSPRPWRPSQGPAPERLRGDVGRSPVPAHSRPSRGWCPAARPESAGPLNPAATRTHRGAGSLGFIANRGPDRTTLNDLPTTTTREASHVHQPPGRRPSASSRSAIPRTRSESPVPRLSKQSTVEQTERPKKAAQRVVHQLDVERHPHVHQVERALPTAWKSRPRRSAP